MPRPSRRPRADASRNRDALLAAADAVFSEHGFGVASALIAERAGVGKGTLFRHFPSKDALISEVVSRRIAELVERGRQLLDSGPADEALLGLLEAIAEQRQEHDLSFLIGGAEPDSAIALRRRELLEVIEALVLRAQHEGSIREDLTGVDVLLLSCAPNHVVEFLDEPSPELSGRYLRLIFDGMRSEGARPLGVPSPLLLR